MSGSRREFTVGHKLLAQAFHDGRLTQAELARRLSQKLGRTVYQSSVSRWLSESFKPAEEIRQAMADPGVIEIPLSSWSEKA